MNVFNNWVAQLFGQSSKCSCYLVILFEIRSVVQECEWDWRMEIGKEEVR